MSIVGDINHRQQDLPLHQLHNAIILGVGGIGSWVALNLALTGHVKKLYLVDPDVVEASNLNRTPFRIVDIDEYKVAALKYLIIERRSSVEIETYKTKTSDELANELYSSLQSDELKLGYKLGKMEKYKNTILHNHVIIDCRDDVYTDFYKLPFKYYKLGYDGMSMTIDGNPRETAVWGHSNGYTFTPSFVGSAQLIANLVVNDILIKKSEEVDDASHETEMTKTVFDQKGRFNKTTTFDCSEIIEYMYTKNNPPQEV